MTDPLDLSADVPDETTRDAVVGLAAAVEREDGAPPLSDAALAGLRSPEVSHLTALGGDAVVGYAQRAGRSIEAVARADAVDAVLDAALETARSAGVTALVWSHGQRSRLAPAFERRGLTRVRELYQLRRPLADGDPLPADPRLPDGVRVRAFEPGRDDAPWLALNAAAFAGHPEQGGFTQTDLDARSAESWFDPSGFLLAERAGELVGFHWTKVHPDGAGEVYVLGVSPAAQGTGLGNALLVRGLRLLAERGCPYVLLYVDGDNSGAVRLYERAGFVRYDVDVQWEATGPAE